MNFKIIKTAVIKTASRTILKTRKYSPEILIGAGVVGVVVATVLACKATSELGEVLEDHKENVQGVKDFYAYNTELKTEEELNEEHEGILKAYKHDICGVYINSGYRIFKLYGPAILTEVFAISSILCSYNIMHKRNLALIAAYEAINKSFAKYRNRVIEQFGDEVDKKIRFGFSDGKVEHVKIDKDGNQSTEEEDITVIDMPSDYARFFDETCTEWSKTPEYNLSFLRHQQDFMNDMLNARGHLFLNEVYDCLGIPRSQAGAVVGWIKDGDGDGYVDFRIYDLKSEQKRAFVNGYERSILLDFNVDGIIYDKI